MAAGSPGPSGPRAALSQLESSPVVQAWELGIRLRQRREEVGFTAAAAGRAIGIIQAYVSGVESGRVKLPARRLAQMIEAYEFEPDDAAELEQLRAGAARRGWWHEYAQLFPAEFLRFLGYEAGAEHIRSFHPEAIHGLLQTEEYARAVIRGGTTTIRLTEVERRVAVRMARQARLDGAHPLRVSALLSEGALRQQVGGPQVMRRQLDHLVRLATERPEQIEVRVLPFSAGAHPAFGGPFEILSFPSPRLPDLVWQEILTSIDIVDQSVRVTDYLVTFAETRELALGSDESVDLIRRIAKEMT
ncbi:helix-turn-helix transcriptional regulator [Micromonospora sp. WMMD712]|uniref:helix-turn-helix domain-containing protein n=1 Tax=Micromonospora TaxID=1873 RepID=UPI00249C410D|nr:helix-turn-helix transcriptional regulator [Micromonospora sp. WMMD712]WFE55461.1 helix-turn-helix transcriptional regulator [Micromonospora sp. WMMD712]